MPSDGHPTRHPYFFPPGPRVLAHRGLVTREAAELGVVENSFAAVAAAHAAGVDYVESDCHVTRDGVAVLFHDDDLTRIAGDPRRLSEVTSTELEAMMSDRGGLIEVAQALDAFPTLRFNLDVKAAAAAETVGRLIAPNGERVLVTSFSDKNRIEALDAANRAGGERPATSPGTATMARLLAAVALGSDRAVRRILAGVDAIQVPERRGRVRVLTPRLVRAAHRHGVEVHVWTVNAPDDVRRLVESGVDGIVTDHADIALETLAP
ncbi:glycerophosphodiester phosphodiesterase family protein [Microbacterium sp. SLBN-146]|uniref:glycerophosphodiester phosphodiesterase family protein n=1 Tax=Microbacterium sp. SLBN-146 TaxID=2768457 RepID=UPI001154D37B|nr:glycerophosphodiester phosphodiesterase family protein [Microbacterium sp. SLBN-146]TQJ32242.1 glycerophosphoryl diester phosphodiesterase [Microbacterium sp. SLBN-146]